MKIALGIGCDRSTPVMTLARALEEALHRAGASRADVAAVGSIDLKPDEPGLLELAAGLGMGWVSLFEPAALTRLLGLPEGARFLAVLCLGQVDAFYPESILETLGWDSRWSLDELVFRDSWGRPDRE